MAIIASGLLILACALLVVSVLAWRSEQDRRRRVEASLATTGQSLAHARLALRQTQRALAKTTAFSTRRGTVLQRVANVLSKVEPLLADVDHLQSATNTIQAARDTFLADANHLITDQIALENRIATAGFNDYVNTIEIPNVNSELSNVRIEAASLSSNDSSYTAASTTFDNDAGSFIQEVRQLQQTLRTVSSPSK